MRVLITKTFKDRATGVVHNAGDILNLPPARATVLIRRRQAKHRPLPGGSKARAPRPSVSTSVMIQDPSDRPDGRPKQAPAPVPSIPPAPRPPAGQPADPDRHYWDIYYNGTKAELRAALDEVSPVHGVAVRATKSAHLMALSDALERRAEER